MHDPTLSPMVGLITGLATGATGVFSIPSVPYPQSLGLQKNELIQALGLSFTVSTITLGAGLLRVDAFDLAHAGASLLAVMPSLGGMLLGRLVPSRISVGVFRAIFFAALLLLGMYLTLGALR